ncbi:hypothetical protein [Vibrio vulnificus]|uniref:hypothetical protein n=1 Tax=Vibrio vulnificus TaxID=672 RepID=UPI00141A4572|nr:hypothetical protein [Vibrio vulnificus]MBN8142963.1 hypothetical protein [Vibrio vulnificus]MBN8152231.1 hypothetical protein [Vibrio vulnificus]NIG89974.1 hypothetical protein [Vibrio vulnificus]
MKPHLQAYEEYKQELIDKVKEDIKKGDVILSLAESYIKQKKQEFYKKNLH